MISNQKFIAEDFSCDKEYFIGISGRLSIQAFFLVCNRYSLTGGFLMDNNSVLLIAFHNQKALGVRYLEKSLTAHGIPVNIIFFKGFNSIKPGSTTKAELELLTRTVSALKPSLIGLSVMTSLYLETVYHVNNTLRSSFSIPIVWGGVYPSLFPEKCLEHADFVIIGEGEEALAELADSIINKKTCENISNLAYMHNGTFKMNDVRLLEQNLDRYGYPEIGGANKFFIDNNRIIRKDPQMEALSYELAASRGCPFSCSFCSSVNLKRIYKGKGRYIRFRSVESIMDELNEARVKLPNLKFIHFWDEIFPSDDEWVDEFVSRYAKEIDLPFEIWVHPLTVRKDLIQKLVKAGLFKAVMGIQSGSERIRKEIFHRPESQEDIFNASKILNECKVPQVIYDFILQHPFETEQDIRESYILCSKLEPPFELQLHALNYFPGTGISEMVVERGIMSRAELEKIMYSPMNEQYRKYWHLNNKTPQSNFWYSLIYLSQFAPMRPVARFMADKYSMMRPAIELCKMARPLSRLRYYYKKGRLLLRAMR